MSDLPVVRTERNDRLWLAAAVALALVYLVGSLWALAGQGALVPDSAYVASVARNLVEGRGFVIDVVGIHPTLLDDLTHVPELHGLLAPFTIAAAFAVLGPSAFATLAVSVVWTTGTAILTFAIGRRLFGAGAGLLAESLVLASPLTLISTSFGSDDVGFTFFFLAAVGCLLAGTERDDPRLFLAAGALAGIALLEKAMGAFVPLVFVAPLFYLPGPFFRRFARVIPAAVPFVLAFGLYLLRNQLAYGELGFRIGAIDWIVKDEGLHAAYALLDGAPSVGEKIASLGAARVWELIATQLAHWLALWSPLQSRLTVFLSPQSAGLMALAGLGWLAWRNVARPFVSTVGLSIVGGALFVCVLYHVEPRYFAYLVPLLAIGLAGALTTALHDVTASGFDWRRHGLAAAILIFVLGGEIAFLALRWIPASVTQHARNATPDPRDRCLGWLRDNVDPDAPILTLEPWSLNWKTGRPTARLPAGPPEDVVRVMDHYGIEWIHRTQLFLKQANIDIERFVEKPPAGREVDLAFEDPSCRIYRYRGTSTGGSGRAPAP